MTLGQGCDALVVDWNGTIVDDLARAVAASNHVLTLHDQPTLTVEQFRQQFTLPLRRFVAGLGIVADRVEAAVRQWNAALLQTVVLAQPGARELLERSRAQRLPVVVLSGADIDVIAHDARHLGLAPLLSIVIAPSTDKAADLRRLAVDLGPNLLFVGDTDADVRSGRSSRVGTVAFTGGYHDHLRLGAAGPDALVGDLRQMIPMLSGPPEPIVRNSRAGVAPRSVGHIQFER